MGVAAVEVQRPAFARGAARAERRASGSVAAGACGAAIALLPLLTPAATTANLTILDAAIVVAIGGCLLWAASSRARLAAPYALPVSLTIIGGTFAAMRSAYPLVGGVAVLQDLFLLAWAIAIANVARTRETLSIVTNGGMAAVTDTVIAAWLTADFREREPQVTANMKAMLLASPVQGYIACCEALSTLDQRELLPKIKSPTLVIAGRHDMSTPVSAGELIRSKIPGASMTLLDAAHISNVEQPHAFTDAVVGFLMQR
jgi:pimeloyl-ACP methyl ester carboxylesterase